VNTLGTPSSCAGLQLRLMRSGTCGGGAQRAVLFAAATQALHPNKPHSEESCEGQQPRLTAPFATSKSG